MTGIRSGIEASRLGTTLVGRSDEVEVARSALEVLQSGQASMVLIEGEAGIGKTVLLQRLVEDARAAAVSIHSGEAHPFESTKPFGAIAAALNLRRTSSDPRAAAIGSLLQGGTEPDARDVRFRVVEEIAGLLETICAESPVLLALEDLHWADSSTLLALRTITADLVHVPLCVVASLRTSPRSPALDLLVGEMVEGGARHIRLEPLTSGAVDQLVRQEIGRDAGSGLKAVIAKAGGNPLWIVELVRSLNAEGALHVGGDVADVTSPALPPSLRELVLRRLRYLSDATLELLQLSAVLGDAISIGDLAVVARRSAPEVLRDLGEAFRAKLLGDRDELVVFRHQLVHDAIYESIPAPVRSALHRDVAGALAHAGAELSQVAGHLVLGASRGDLEAVRWLRKTARDATSRDPSLAVDLLHRASALLPDGHRDTDVIAAERVQALLRAGRVAEAADEADALLAGRHRAELEKPVRLWLLETLSLQNRGVELIERSEATLSSTPDLTDAERALVLAQASYGRLFSGDVVGAEATGRRALETAERSGDVPMIVWSLSTTSVSIKTQGRYDEALSLAEQAVRLAFERPDIGTRLRHPYFFPAYVLSDTDRFTEARAMYAKAANECRELGSAWLLPDTLLLAAELRFIVGEWDDAETEIESGLRIAHEHGARISIPQSRGYQAIMATARGDLDAADHAIETVQLEMVSAEPNYGSEIVAYAMAMISEARGQASTAYDLLAWAWALDERRQVRYYHRYLGPSMVRVGLLLEKRDDARAVSDSMEATAAVASDVPSIRSAALRCRGLLENDGTLMMDAVELARTSGRFLDRVHACEDAAAVLASTGRNDDARDLLTEALEACEDVRADAWASRLAANLRRFGARRGTRGPRNRPLTGWESLTRTERSVSHLVADGLTNREIARRLYVSPHTVNTHLRHVFQKLGVSNRAGLAAETARHAD